VSLVSVLLPSYIEYGPRLTFPGSFLAKGGHFLGLVLNGDAEKLAELCKRVLSDPAEGKCTYRPLAPYIVMLVGSWEQLSSRGPGLEGGGTVCETCMMFWLPVLATDADGSERVCLFAPYVFVDNQMSLLIGREDFGYAKAIAQFEPRRVIIPPEGTTTIEAYGGNLNDPRVQAEWYKAVTLKQTQADIERTPAESKGALDVAKKLAPLLQQPGLDPERHVSAAKAFFEGKTREVFLKQFRDASQATRSCFRQVVESPIVVSNPEAWFLPQSWEVTVRSSGTYPIVEELGIEKKSTALFAYELRLDMELCPGLIVAHW
jgi:hypothetical protein